MAVLDLKAGKPAKTKTNRRKRESRPRDWKKFFRVTLRLGVSLGTVVLIGFGAVLVGRLIFESDYFRIASVRVENESRVSSKEILALSEIRTGTRIFELDLDAIGRKIAENPWVATAGVRRIFPQEVLIRVVEREPRAIVNLGYLYYLDGTGEVFKVLEPGDSLDFPVFTGIDRTYLLESPEEARRLFAEALALLEKLEARAIFGAGELSEIHIHPADGFHLHTLVGGVPIRMGRGNYDDKLDRLERIYPELRPRLQALKYIDLNVIDRVIVKLDTTGVRRKT
jgi:cell division protein FtsQ